MTGERNYIIHPLYIIITLVLASVSALFIGFTVAYIYSRVQNGLPPVKIPTLFFVNTAFLMLASALFIIAKKAYLEDRTTRFKILLWATLGITIIFLFAQILAWWQMIQMNLDINSSTLGSYLYVISGVHFVHVIAGIPFLVHFLHEARKNLVEPVSVLVYFSDPHKKRKLDILSIYWHFLDGLWIFLIIFFLMNQLI